MDEIAVKLLESSLSAFVTMAILIIAFRPLLKTIADRDKSEREREKEASANQRAEYTLLNNLAVGSQEINRETVSAMRAINNTLQAYNTTLHAMHAQQLANTSFIGKIPDIVIKADGLAEQLSKTKQDLEARHNRHDEDNQVIRSGVEALQSTVTQAVTNLQAVGHQLNAFLVELGQRENENTTPQPDNTAPSPGLESGESQQDSAVVNVPASPAN